MSRLAPLVVVAALAGIAHAEPATRLGLTMGIADQGAPGVFQIGPQASLGERLGGLVAELDYAYLSFFDPQASPTGVHRLGVTLRGELLHSENAACVRNMACTRAHSLYLEGGVAERFGKWQIDATHTVPATSPTPEAHVGIGIELDNRLRPYRYGWQAGVRFSVSRNDTGPDNTCRTDSGSCMSTSTVGTSGGLNKALMLEWMFLFGR